MNDEKDIPFKQDTPREFPEGQTIPAPVSKDQFVDHGNTIPVPIPVLQEGVSSSMEHTVPVDTDAAFWSGQDIAPTRPTEVSAAVPLQPSQQKVGGVKKRKNLRRWLWGLTGLALIVLVAALGSWMGYNTAIQRRVEGLNSQRVITAMEQFQLGLQDQAAGRLDSARQRFEYVIKLDPAFPGAAEKLTEVMLAIATVSAPTSVPTARPTLTPDTRGKDGYLASAQAYLQNSQWDAAIQSIELLRKEDQYYRALEADGLLYIALRNRGVERIYNSRLEAGIADLLVAERMAPLDKEAYNLRQAAQYYLIGASFWQIDWSQAIYYLGQVYPALANLRDSSMTAGERYRHSLIGLADQQAAQGDYCGAEQNYRAALQMGGNDPVLGATATVVYLICYPPTATPEPTQIFIPPTSPPDATPQPTPDVM